MTTAEERFEHMVAMAMQAWDECDLMMDGGSSQRMHFEAVVRERLAQSAQVYELEIGAAERPAPMPEGW